MELARQTGKESLKYFKGEISLDCDICPVKCKHFLGLCEAFNDVMEVVGAEFAELYCHGALMKFLFSED